MTLTPRKPALHAIRIIDLSRVLGPWCTRRFRDLGADAIKIQAIADPMRDAVLHKR